MQDIVEQTDHKSVMKTLILPHCHTLAALPPILALTRIANDYERPRQDSRIVM